MSHNRVRKANYRGSLPRKILNKERGKLLSFSSCSVRGVSLSFEKPREGMQTNRSGRPPTPALLSVRGFDRSIAARLCSIVFAESSGKRETVRSVLQLGRNLAGEQNSIHSNHSDLKAKNQT